MLNFCFKPWNNAYRDWKLKGGFTINWLQYAIEITASDRNWKLLKLTDIAKYFLPVVKGKFLLGKIMVKFKLVVV